MILAMTLFKFRVLMFLFAVIGVGTAVNGEGSDSIHCDFSNFIFGRWINGKHQGMSISSCGLATAYERPIDEEASDHGEGGNWGDYCWEPNDCALRKFSRHRFCHMLQHHSILIIGDSTQYLFYQSFFKEIEINGEPAEQYDRQASRSICNSTVTLKFLRNDQLIPSFPADANLFYLFYDWTLIVDNFDIIVVQKGCHVIDHEEFRNYTELGAIEFGKRLNNTNKLLVYRTTPQPHPYCDMNDVPATRVIESSRDIVFVGFDEESKYNDFKWYLIPQRDERSIATYKHHICSDNIVVMDVAPMTSLRPDGHRADRGDCLHYYLPSVVDSWVHVLYNILVSRFEKNQLPFFRAPE